MDPRISVSQSLTRIVFTVSGTDGKAWEVVVDESWHETGSGNRTFNTSLFGVGPHTVILFIAGFQVASTTYVEMEVVYPPEPPLPPPPPPPPGDSGVEILQAIGTSCHLIHKFIARHESYMYRSDLTGAHSGDYSEWKSAVYYGEQDSICQQTPPPPPPPPPTTGDLANRISRLESNFLGIGSAIAGIQTLISEIISAAEEEAAALRARLDTAIADVRSYTKSAIFEIDKNVNTRINDMGEFVGQISDVVIPDIWKNINEIYSAAEEEALAWRKGVLDLDASLKAWIEDQILEVLWRAMNRDVEVK